MKKDINWVDEVKGAAQISEVVGRYLGGARQGMIRCPFHKDKTPSMSINSQKNMFYCFGCGVGGDSITFVQKMDNLEFIDACKKIAEWYGIKINRIGVVSDERRAYEQLILWASNNLNNSHIVKEYLTNRGLDEHTMQAFKLGWINKEWKKFLESNGMNSELLERMGIPQNIIFLFEDRIIFPIIVRGQCLGIGGRGLAQQVPKYLNTGVKKKELLFGFDQARIRIGNQPILLVEGYLDAMLCYQYKIAAVASLGTNVSEEQLKLCFELSKVVIVCMDGDIAGRAAGDKIALKLLSLIKPGHSAHFIDLSESEDPASCLSKNQVLPSNKITLLQRLWRIFDPKGQNTKEKQIEAYEELMKTLEVIENPNLRYLYISEARKMWRGTANVIKLIDSPQRIRVLLLLSIVAHFPHLFDNFADYILSMHLEGDLYEFREYMLKLYPQNADKIPLIAVESFGLYGIEKICALAPFMIDVNRREAAWFEFFLNYWNQEEILHKE